MRRNTEGPMNENGLSLQRWWAAATFGADQSQFGKSNITKAKMKQAWRDGECPCDYAAHFANVTPRERR
jgi:hypothetical protein